MSSQNEIEFNFNSSSSSTNTVSNAKNNDPSMFLVSTRLTGNENYMQWKFSIRIALGAKKKIGFIDGTIKKPKSEGSELDDWISNDCMVRSWLLNVVSKEIAGAFIFATTAQELWIELEEHFGESNGPLIYQLQRQIASINQGDSSLSKYYTKLKQLWDQLSCLIEIPNCKCGSAKVISEFTSSMCMMQFLMGLNDTYENLRNQILVLDPLPSVHKAYSMALSVEKQKEVQINFSIPNEASAMYVKASNHHNNDKKQFSYKQKTENKKNGDKYCNFCKVNGHSREICFKLNGYPDRYKEYKDKKKNNFNSANMVNANQQEDNPLFQECSSSSNSDNNESMNALFQQFTQFMKMNQKVDPHSVNFSHLGDFTGPGNF